MTRRPISTYRLQIRSGFDLDAAAAVTGYLSDLGVDWAYLSPLLKASDGSDHGYDVVDSTLVDPARGGREGLDRFAAAARAAGLGILIDIVPNHMGVAVPAQNPWWWDVLTFGRESRYAAAFDIDWDFGSGKVRLPILGGTVDEALEDVEVVLQQSQQTGPGEAQPSPGVVKYFDHVLPLAPGSVPSGVDLTDPAVIRDVLDGQHWELLFWRREAAELNYRRFFAVTTLAGVRVETPWVFDESHAEVLRWVREGLADGLRVDHPDGLLDPGGYLARLADATGGAYVLVEKILEHGEDLPAWWETDGTTGYDALAEFDRLLIDPAGEGVLNELDAVVRPSGPRDYSDVIHDTKRMIADTIQGAEIARLVRELPDLGAAPESEAGGAGFTRLDPAVARDALAELLTCFPVYRSYLPAGREQLDRAAAEASDRRPDLAAAIASLVPVLADPAHAVARRFQQTTGPVMAKGVEDTAFYRYNRLGSLTEVGGDPSVFALTVDDFHLAQSRRQAQWPAAMTTLSTHDTKRGEDVRARLDVLSEIPERWADLLADLRAGSTSGHAGFDDLLYQAAIGAWPITRERLHAYAEKASREAAEATGWWDPDAAFEERMHATIDAIFDDAQLNRRLTAFVNEIALAGWSNALSAKLLQLTGPGVPDVYQGSELWETSLVDPDNRREVDFDLRRRMLSAIDSAPAGEQLPSIDASGAAKLLVTSRALRLRRDRPDLFTRYTPMSVVGEASAHAVAFDRGGTLTVATRLPVGLASRGGWGETVLLRHGGPTRDALTGRRFTDSMIPLTELLGTYPVALLVSDEPDSEAGADS
ncbi:malto-oligosyltrehalose synthase [Microbacterium pygmaeum]|uniref:Maltooligosyl trehalose synthase n=1 Tax=Microbacterium pygmaeum TaxID=370764 RepID=A0A1G8A6H2_9MICO|nr:malto-oligosyltrehalose synthase [Microbacterium pygmaeum]SDH16575.1 maltooligosyl trehalose synthase [Microbacterium pygmaeum]